MSAGAVVIVILAFVGVGFLVREVSSRNAPPPAPTVQCFDGSTRGSASECPIPPPTPDVAAMVSTQVASLVVEQPRAQGGESADGQTAVQPTTAPASTDTSVQASTGQYPQCGDIQSVADAAARLGGSAANWEKPRWVDTASQGAWVFRSRQATTLQHPGFGFFDTPDGMFQQSNVTAFEASFHCEAPPA